MVQEGRLYQVFGVHVEYFMSWDLPADCSIEKDRLILTQTAFGLRQIDVLLSLNLIKAFRYLLLLGCCEI